MPAILLSALHGGVTVRGTFLCFPFYTWGHQHLKKAKHLPKITEGSVELGLEPSCVWFQVYLLNYNMLLLLIIVCMVFEDSYIISLDTQIKVLCVCAYTYVYITVIIICFSLICLMFFTLVSWCITLWKTTLSTLSYRWQSFVDDSVRFSD